MKSCLLQTAFLRIFAAWSPVPKAWNLGQLLWIEKFILTSIYFENTIFLLSGFVELKSFQSTKYFLQIKDLDLVRQVQLPFSSSDIWYFVYKLSIVNDVGRRYSEGLRNGWNSTYIRIIVSFMMKISAGNQCLKMFKGSIFSIMEMRWSGWWFDVQNFHCWEAKGILIPWKISQNAGDSLREIAHSWP